MGGGVGCGVRNGRYPLSRDTSSFNNYFQERKIQCSLTFLMLCVRPYRQSHFGINSLNPLSFQPWLLKYLKICFQHIPCVFQNCNSLEVKLPYDPGCPLVGPLVGLSQFPKSAESYTSDTPIGALVNYQKTSSLPPSVCPSQLQVL